MKKALFLLQIILMVVACLLFSCCAATPASMSERGSAWLSGSGIPTVDAGETGDYYLDFETGSVYEKTAQGWTVRGNLTQATEERKTITITFDASGGELPKGYLRENTLNKGDCFALPVPTREGYLFLGWFYGEGANGGQASDLTVFARDVLLTAKWRKLHVLTLKGAETNRLGGEGEAYQFSGEYDGTDAATFTFYLEKDGVRKRAVLGECEWIAQNPKWNFTQSNHTFRGSFILTETGDYRLILVVEEGDETLEASVAFSATE